MYQERFLYDTIPGRPSCHAGTILELPSGEFLAAFYAGTREGAPDVAVLTVRLRSELDDWSELTTVIDTPGKSEGNPVLHADTYGHVWLFYVTQQEPGWDYVLLYAMKSEDEGRTWEEPVLLSQEQGWMVRNKPIRLSSGRTVLPCYDEVNWRGFCLVSDDECVTWRKSGWMEGPVTVIQPTLIERPDGSLFALLRNGAPEDRPEQRVLWQSVSTDGGMSWSVCEPTELPNPDSGADMAGLDNGNTVLVYNDTKKGRSPLTVALSEDGGRTWPIRRNLETEPAEFSYPAVIQHLDGNMNALYTYKRTHMKHVIFDEAWVRGEDE